MRKGESFKRKVLIDIVLLSAQCHGGTPTYPCSDCWRKIQEAAKKFKAKP